MSKYLFFLVLGIIIFIVYNSVDNFSVGVPEYLLTINDDGIISIDTTIYSSDPDTWSTSESIPVIEMNENRYYVYGDDIDDAQRNYDTYIASVQSMAGGVDVPFWSDWRIFQCAASSHHEELLEEQEEQVIRNLMTPETREYLSGPGSNWISTTMGFGSALDENLLVCIQALVSSGESRGDSKVSVFIGQAYFILLSLFFTNSTLIFVDVNIHLLQAMKNIIDNFENIDSFDELFRRMESVNLREVYKSQSDLRKVKELLSIDNERILFQRCKQNFRNNTYVLCEASITDAPLLDYLNDYTLDYFSITNLPAYNIPNFWDTINTLQIDNPGLLFIASNGLAVHQYIFQYDSSQLHVFTTDNPNIFNFILSGYNWRNRATQFYAQYDFVKYVYVVRNQEQILLKNTL